MSERFSFNAEIRLGESRNQRGKDRGSESPPTECKIGDRDPIPQKSLMLKLMPIVTKSLHTALLPIYLAINDIIWHNFYIKTLLIRV